MVTLVLNLPSPSHVKMGRPIPADQGEKKVYVPVARLMQGGFRTHTNHHAIIDTATASMIIPGDHAVYVNPTVSRRALTQDEFREYMEKGCPIKVFPHTLPGIMLIYLAVPVHGNRIVTMFVAVSDRMA